MPTTAAVLTSPASRYVLKLAAPASEPAALDERPPWWDDPGQRRKGQIVESSKPANVLVVAYRTAATPALLDAVRERAAHGPAHFHLLVPNPAEGDWHLHQKLTEGEHVLALALPLIDEASGGFAYGSVSTRHDPMDAIEETLRSGDFDEIILSTLPRHVSRWLHVDLPHRVGHLGLPLTTVIAQGRAKDVAAAASGAPG